MFWRARELEVMKDAVQFSSVPELLHKLCQSLLVCSLFETSSFLCLSVPGTTLEPVKQAYLHDRGRLQRLARRLVLLCYDVVLLRKWQWMGSETRCISHSLGVALSLHSQGKTSKAGNLANAITSLLSGEEASDLTEPESILQFLFLLSSPNACGDVQDVPHTREGHVYPFYPR